MDSEEFDYSKLGLKAGLEIHQQLDTRKLFCNCPSVLRYDESDYTISRKLHAVAGEKGEVDIAAMHEVEKGKEFIYQGYDTNCLIELDESPPREINKEALKIAIQIALLLNMKIIPVTQIMRKTVVDGSNTSGFQRTILIAQNGFIETSFGRVGIEELYLEEDAARMIEKKEKKTIFRLDRLGIPLVEIKTAPDLKTPKQIKEAALKIGGILRNAKVKRGLGTIRQDLNISIKTHPRVEIKGFQNPKMMIKTIEYEIQRQKKEGKKGKPEVRNALPDGTTEFLRPMPGAARMYPETDLSLLKISRELINEAKKELPKLREELEEEFRKKGLNEEMIKLLFKEKKIEEFKELLKIINKPQLIVKVLLIFPKEIASKKKMSLKKVLDKIEDEIPNVLRFVKEGKIPESRIKYTLVELVEGKSLNELKVGKKNIADIEEKIRKIIKDKPGLSVNAYMGLIMKNPEFKGQINGRDAAEIIK
ncbi:Glu-tRNA(Gln) amidotransferase GatDE subunit E, partial [Candidatus Pacearchaeota archaeon]